MNYTNVKINSNASRSKIIIGDDRRTPYADIDLALKADPLPESDSSDENDNDGNDAFMTLEEMQSLVRVRNQNLEEDH